MTLVFWHWLILGAALVGLEAVVPGVFLLWFGIAGIATGLLLLTPLLFLLPDIPWQGQLLTFAALSVVSILVGRRVAARGGERNDHPHLNQPGNRLIGRDYTLQAPIADGRGTLSIQDNTWIIAGPDLPAGSRVRVTGVAEGELQVEAASQG